MKKVTSSIILLTTFIILFPNDNVHAQKKHNIYRNTEHAFSIVLPDGWSTRGGQTPHTIVVAEDNKGASIVIQVWQLPEDISWDQYSDQYLQQTAKGMFNELKRKTYHDAVLDDYGVTYLSNRKAIRIVCRFSVRNMDGKYQVKNIMLSVAGNMRMVQIQCSAPISHFPAVKKVFHRSCNSFLFEDPSWYK